MKQATPLVPPGSVGSASSAGSALSAHSAHSARSAYCAGSTSSPSSASSTISVKYSQGGMIAMQTYLSGGAVISKATIETYTDVVVVSLF